MKKTHLFKLTTITFLSLTCVLLSKPAHAQDMEITCADQGACDMQPSPGAALFTETNWLPGDTILRTILITNNDTDDDCVLTMDTVSETQSYAGFAARLYTAMRRDGANLIFGQLDGSDNATSVYDFQDVFDASSIPLGTIPQDGGSSEYEWVVTFDLDAGNEFQEAQTQFDFNLYFECGPPPEDTGPVDKTQRDRRPKMDHGGGGGDSPTPTPTPTPVPYSPFAALIEAAEVAGESTESTESEPPQVTPPALPEVKGEAIALECVDPWWWFLVFVIQIVVHFVVYKAIRKDHFNKRARYYLGQLFVTAVFGYIFWKYFCPLWDVAVSILIGTISFFLTKSKLDNLEKRNERVQNAASSYTG